MIRTTGVCIALVTLLGFGTVGQAADLEPMTAEMCQLYAQHLTDLFNKESQDRQAKFEVDPSQATGVRAGQDGIILVPAKGLKEGNVDPAVETECGGGLCYLFMSPCFAPTVSGKPVDLKKLRTVKFDNGQGEQREAICLLVTVKHVEGDDWRLFGYGPDKSPVINAQFGLADAAPDKQPLALKVSGKDNSKLELTLYKKYSAFFNIASK